MYAFFLRWSRRGLPERLAGRLRGRLRVLAGRGELPTAGCVDSQTVKAAETVWATACGFDGGKKIKGQKRHIAVDTLGLLLCVIVTAASVQDRDGAHPLLALLREKFSTVALVWADGGYAGRLLTWAREVLHLTVTIVKRSDDLRGFVVLPAQVGGRTNIRLADSLPATGADLRTQARTPRSHDLVVHRAPDDPPPDPRTGRTTTPWPLERPATAARAVQPRPARQRPETASRSALAGVERERVGRHPRNRERQQLPRSTVSVVPAGLHQQAWASPLRAHPHEHLSLCQQALSGSTDDVIRAHAAITGKTGSSGTPWPTGTFYLLVFIAVALTLMAVGKVISVWWLPVVIVGGLLTLVVVSAAQLRHDGKLSEVRYVALIRIALAKLPSDLLRAVRRGTPTADSVEATPENPSTPTTS
ncbi:transposase [Nonomuraea sp. NPDC050451]|uniref:transposase n=1 Tax=Nonomuraea sp. NPDC050451 TaxID=3364364 RepID=UPI0037A7FB63